MCTLISRDLIRVQSRPARVSLFPKRGAGRGWPSCPGVTLAAHGRPVPGLGSPLPSCRGLPNATLLRAGCSHGCRARTARGRHPPPLGGILHRANLVQAGEHLPFSYVFQHPPPPPVISHGNKKPVVKSRPCDPHLHLALSSAFLGRAEISPHGPHRNSCEQRCLPQPCSSQCQQIHLGGSR